MKLVKKMAALLMAFVMVFTSMGTSYAMYYDEYRTASDVSIFNTVPEGIKYWDYSMGDWNIKNSIRFTLDWSEVKAYSFDGDLWHRTNAKRKTFFIVENYLNSQRWNGTEVVMPLSVNVLFVYIKDKNDQTSLFTYKLSQNQLDHIYGSKNVPMNIIKVTDAIDQLPLKANLLISDEQKVINVRRLYETLSTKDQSWVYNVHKLYDLETKLDELKNQSVDWSKIFKDLDTAEASAGKLTEQYYAVPDKLYDEIYKSADKTKIYQTKLGNPRYNNAAYREHILKDTTPSSENVFFLYDFNKPDTKNVWSSAMAKKVWGFFYPAETGKYQFRIYSDDGHTWQMYLNNGTDPSSDTFNIQNASTTITSKYDLHNISYFDTDFYTLKANTPYPIFIEYFNHGGNAALKLEYRIVKDNNSNSNWVTMSGNMFKPSKSYEFGFKSGNSSELLSLITKVEGKVTEFSAPGMIGVTEGKVSQAAFDALKQQLELAKAELDRAMRSMLTQAQIDEATQKLKIALDAFNNAIVKKPNGVTAAAMSQQKEFIQVAFNKDVIVDKYEIIISADNTISADDALYVVENGNYNLKGANKLDINTGSIKGELFMQDSTTPYGRYKFDVPLGDKKDSPAVNVFIRTATKDNKGDATAKTITLLKKVNKFKYSVANGQVTFYSGEKVTDTGFAFSYYPIGGAEMKEVYLAAAGKEYYMISESEVDISKIDKAEAYRIALDGTIPSPSKGRSVSVSNPEKQEVKAVENLKLEVTGSTYTLSWDPFVTASGYGIYEGSTADITKMTKWEVGTTDNRVTLKNADDGKSHYYAVRAILSDNIFKKSALSNVVKAYKPKAPELYDGIDGKTITPPETTNYVIKGDGETKGYYLITMPKDLLKLNGAVNVKPDASGNFKMDRTDKDSAGKIKSDAFAILSQITWVPFNKEGQSSDLITYKVPFDKADVGFTVEALKNKLTEAGSKQISITKHVEDLSVNDTWAIGKTYKVGDLIAYKGFVYKCLQAHTVYADNWEPKLAPALWELIDSHSLANDTVQGISEPANINIVINVTPPDVKKEISIEAGTNVSIKGEVLTSPLGTEFEIKYKLEMKVDDMYDPKFVFDLVDNQYFSFDYPTIKAEITEDGKNVPLNFKTQVIKSTKNEVTKTEVTLISEDDFNFGKKDVYVTLKIKPTVKNNKAFGEVAKSIVDNNAELKKAIGDYKDWKLSYVIGELTFKDKPLTEGLSIVNHTEFNTTENRPGTDKEILTPVETLYIKFKSEPTIDRVN